MNKSPHLSVVIPTYNEEKDIGFCIESLNKQSFGNFEIIIVDDGSTDKTKEILSKFKKVKIISGQHKGPGFSRNLGAKSARGKILIFIDADMTFDKDYLKNLTAPFKDKSIIGTTHDYEVVENIKNIWSRCWGRVRVSKEEAKDVKIFRAIRKDKFLKLGGFDPQYGYADDQTFWFKYKIKPVVAKNATCYHRNPETLKGVYKQSRWIGASIDNSLTRTPLLMQIAPFFLILISPLAIPILSIKRCSKNNNFKILFPWMITFMAARYFGTITGIFRKAYLKKNLR